MPNMPAICDTCGTAFKSGLVIEASRNVTLSGNTAGPCPNCGNMGHIPDGVFNFIGDAIEILKAPQITIQELMKFSRILQSAKKNNTPPERLREEIQQTTPELNSLFDLQQANQGVINQSLQFWITTILAILQLVISFSQAEEKPQQPQEIIQKIEVNQVINNFNYDQPNAKPSNPAAINQNIKNEPVRVNKVGRNAPCPCGSGKKYKNCHLNLKTQH